MRWFFALLTASLVACSSAQTSNPPLAPNPPFAAVSDATYSQNGAVLSVQIPSGSCSQVTSSPIAVGDWVLVALHDSTLGCSGASPYARWLLGFHVPSQKLYKLNDGGPTEATLLYDPASQRVYWPTLASGQALKVLDATTFQTLSRSTWLKPVIDSSGVLLNGLYYFGTVNTPFPTCQNPIEANCGALFAATPTAQASHTLNTVQGFRAWNCCGLTTDGQFVYSGTAPQTLGNSESGYRYGCSVVKLSPSMQILAHHDPGVQGCYRTGLGANDEDAVIGEMVLAPQAVWAQWRSPTDNRNQTTLIRYDRNLNELCRYERNTGPKPTGNYYAGATVDAQGNAYFALNLPDGPTVRGTVLKLSPTCQATELVVLPGVRLNSTPVLAGSAVLVATAGQLSLYSQSDGQRLRSHALASKANVYASPMVHQGQIYVLSADGSLHVVTDPQVKDYGDAYWPRYRRDNHGRASLVH